MLRAIPWAKAHMSHLGGWSPSMILFSLSAARSMKARPLTGRNRLAGYRRWTGSGAGWNSLSDLGRPRRRPKSSRIKPGTQA